MALNPLSTSINKVEEEACCPQDGAVLTLKGTLLVQLSGNAAVIKPSEVSFHSAKVMEELLPLYLDKVDSFLCFLFILSVYLWDC